LPTLPTALPLSASDDIVWPAFPAGAGARLLSILFQLEQSQWWDSERLQQAQFSQLGQLLAHSLESVPHYAPLRQTLDWQPGTELSPETWQRLPVLSRATVQAAGAALRTTRGDLKHGGEAEVHTSGSTGTPIRIAKSAVSDLMFAAISLRDHIWQRRDVSQKFCLIKTFPDGVANYPEGLSQPHWGDSLAGLFATGPSAALAITATIDQQWQWLAREQPAYLLAFPSVVEALARYSLEHNKSLESLAQVSTLGETLDPQVPGLVTRAWGVETRDMYSAQEVGYMALQCPESGNYHLQSEVALVEVLDQHDKPCGPGQVGRVVVTPLHNFVMPLLRYEVGDFAEVGDTCDCGRTLPVVTRILGRSRNILTLPDGNRLWPRLSELLYETIVPVRQFQVIQKSRQKLEVRLVVARPVSSAEEEQLAELICRRIGHSFVVRFSYHEAIPRSGSGKYEDFRSEL